MTFHLCQETQDGQMIPLQTNLCKTREIIILGERLKHKELIFLRFPYSFILFSFFAVFGLKNNRNNLLSTKSLVVDN